MKATRRMLTEVTLKAEHPGDIQPIPTYRESIFIDPEVVTISYDAMPTEDDPVGFRRLTASGQSYRLLAGGIRKPTHRTDEVTWTGPRIRQDLHELIRQTWRELPFIPNG